MKRNLHLIRSLSPFTSSGDDEKDEDQGNSDEDDAEGNSEDGSGPTASYVTDSTSKRNHQK